MKPVQFKVYTRKGTQDEFRFIGYGQLVKKGVPTARDVCILAPSVSGFELAENNRFKPSPEHTLYQIVEVEEFFDIFEEGEK